MADERKVLGIGLRLKIHSALAGIGALGGAVAGIVLTYAGNVISGYPIPPDLGIYALNSGIMAAIGGVLGPPVAWTMLRRVPLWRAIAEPVAAGVTGGVLAMLLAPAWFPLIAPAAILASAGWLSFRFRERAGRAVGEGAAALPALGSGE